MREWLPQMTAAGRLNEALDFCNAFAPEHLEIITADPMGAFRSIRNAGSVFLGKYTPVAAGDYASGTNHVLPTSGYARVFSGLNVDHFTKKISVQMITDDGLLGLEETITTLAEAEGLEGTCRVGEAEAGAEGVKEYPPPLCVHPPGLLPGPLGERGAMENGSKAFQILKITLVLFLISEGKKDLGPSPVLQLLEPFILCLPD